MVEIVCDVSDKAISRDLTRVLDRYEFYDVLGDKSKWGISVYSKRPEIVRKLSHILEAYFKARLRRNGLRKLKYVPAKPLNLQGWEPSLEVPSEEVASRCMVDEGLEVVAAHLNERLYVGRTLGVVDHEAFKTRDLKRPFQRPSLSMPPKLARILVNLSGVKKGELLLDPFCGIGTILAEALVMGIDARGIDIEPRRVYESRMNLSWLAKGHRISLDLKTKVVQGDARRLSRYFDEESVDGIATEPILLPPFRRFPPSSFAKEGLSKAESIYLKSLLEMAKVLKRGGRIAIVVPYVRTKDGALLSFSFEPIIKRAGLSFYRPRGFLWSYPLWARPEPDQKVLRGIYVLVKDQR